MRKILLTLSVFLFFGVQAQPLTERLQIRFSEMYKNTMDHFFYHSIPLGYTNSTYYGLLLNPNRYLENAMGNKRNSLMILRNDLVPIRKTKLEFLQDGKDTWDEHHVMLHGTMYVFFSYLNRSLQKEFLFVKVFDTATLKPVGELKKVAEVDYSAFHKYKPRSFQFHYSPDSSRMLISYAITNKDGLISSQGFLVFDDKINEQWSLLNALPLESNKYYLMDKYLVTNEGDVYVVTKVYHSEKDYQNAGKFPSLFLAERSFIEFPRFTYEIFSISKSQRNRFTPKVPGYFIRTLQVACPKQGTVICSGLFSDSGFVSVKGSFNIMVEEGVPRLSSKFLFPVELIGKGMDEDEYKDLKRDLEKKKEFETYSYDNFGIHFTDDGGYWYLAEQLKQQILSRGSSVVTRLYFDGIYIVRYDNMGNFLWANKLAKSQPSDYAINDFCSAKVLTKGDELLFVYNLLPDLDKINFSFKYRAEGIMAVSYDNNGKESKKYLVKQEDKNVVIMPGLVQKGDNDTYYFYTPRSMRKYYFMELKL